MPPPLTIPFRRRGRLPALAALLLPVLLSCDDMTSPPTGPSAPQLQTGCRPDIPLDEMPVQINEVMVVNETTLADGLGRFSPWIELYNPTSQPFDLGGVALSDDLLEARKWSIPCIPEAIIPPEGFLIIFLDGNAAPGKLHTSFVISPGEIQLTLNRGSDTFLIDATEAEPDVSSGRFPDGEGRIVRSLPTPGEPNSGPLPPREEPFVRGDANGDGRVTVSDLSAILRVVFGGEPLPRCPDRLDADDDGLISEQDGVYLEERLFGSGPPPPPPHPEAGADPTADDLRCFE